MTKIPKSAGDRELLIWSPKQKLALSIPLECLPVKYWPVPVGSVTLLWFLQIVAKSAKNSDFALFLVDF